MYVDVLYADIVIGRIIREKDGNLIAQGGTPNLRRWVKTFVRDYDITTGGTDDYGNIWNGTKTIKTTDKAWFDHLSENINGLFEASKPMTETDLEDEDFKELMQDVDDYNERMDLMEEVEAYKNYVDSKYGEDEQSGVSEEQQ